MSRNVNFSLGCGIGIGVSLCLAGLGVIAFLYLGSNGWNSSAPTQTPVALFPTATAPAPPTAPAQVVFPTVVENGASAAPTLAPLTRAAIPYQAVVKISAIRQGKELWYGSGTVITPDGLILTNAHVVLPEKPYTADGLMISFTEQEDKAPVPRYFAEVVQADQEMDIAVLRITSDINNLPLDRNTLNLPTVQLGNSDELHIGAPLLILGYPNIGGSTITLTRGDVAGFTSDAYFGDRAFVKTSATITGGNSGGLAANESGQLVGVPTQLGYGGEGELVDCRPLADTNRDGVVDDSDTCIPTGGFINALRPINLAMPLIEAAKRGEVAVSSSHAEHGDMPASGQLLYQDDFSDPASGWDNRSGPTGITGYTNGVYQISVADAQTFVWGRANREFGDVIIKVDAKPIRYTGNEDYGVICRYVDKNNFYALEISLDGYYSIWKIEQGERITLVDWQSSLVVPTSGEAVTLTAGCMANGLALAVDGVVVAEVSERAIRQQGDVGLIAGTWDFGGGGIAFDNFAVYQP